MAYHPEVFDRVVFYRELFSLDKNISLSRFIKYLDRKDFLPFVLTIHDAPLFSYCKLNFQYDFPFTAPFMLGVANPFSSSTLFDTGFIRYSKDKKDLVLEVSLSTGWVIFYVLCFCFFAVMLILLISLGLFGLDLLFASFLLAPSIFVIRRDIRRWQRISQFAIDLSKSSKRKK